MSDGTESNPNKIQTEPLKKIGAQDLIKVDYKICGHLRKQGKVNKLFGSRKWNLKFIIVSQGCVYCFNSEHSENPVSAFSLCIYEAVQEVSAASMPHSFEIVPEERGKATHVFACETDEKRREWILCLEEVLQQCRQFLGKLSADSGIDEGVPSKKGGRRNLPPLPNVPGKDGTGKAKKYKEAKSEYDLESEEEDELGDDSKLDAYDDVDLPSERAPSVPQPATHRTPATLPSKGKVQVLPFPPGIETLRGSRGTISDRPPVPLPVPGKYSTLPSRLPSSSPRGAEGYINNSVFQESDYIFDSSDRAEVMNLMQTKSEGTFLIRNARSGPGKVLTVMTEIGIKEFQITDKDGKVSLDNKESFPAISALLTFYNQNNLPKSEYKTKLLRGYNS